MCLLIANMQYYVNLHDTEWYDMIKYQFVHFSVYVYSEIRIYTHGYL